jgi:hypothetical protein
VSCHESASIAPGQTADLLVPIPKECRPHHIALAPETAAAFTLERADALSTDAMFEATNGQILSPGVILRVRNDSARPERARFQIDFLPDLEILERELGKVVESGWREAYDRAKAALRNGAGGGT